MVGATAGNAGPGQAPWTDFSWQQWSVEWEFGYAPRDFLGLGPGVYRVQPFLAQAGGPTQGGISFNFEQQLGHKSPFGWFGRFGVGGSQVSGGASTQIGSGFVMEGPLEHLGLVPRADERLHGHRVRLEPALRDFADRLPPQRVRRRDVLHAAAVADAASAAGPPDRVESRLQPRPGTLHDCPGTDHFVLVMDDSGRFVPAGLSRLGSPRDGIRRGASLPHSQRCNTPRRSVLRHRLGSDRFERLWAFCFRRRAPCAPSPVSLFASSSSRAPRSCFRQARRSTGRSARF